MSSAQRPANDELRAKPIGRILITNDDGINAPGIKELKLIAAELADEVWIFAPDGNCSGFGRSLTITRELAVTKHDAHTYSCDGTPTDCIILALNHFMKDHRPDLVLSGINLGMNVADDITCSGTIGAAWEAVVHGVPAIAMSQKYDRKKMDLDNPEVFSASRDHAATLVEDLWQQGWPEHILMNVNFPSVPADQVKGRKAVNVGRHKAADDVETGEGENTYRIGMWRLRDDLDPEADIGAVFDGYITLCPLSINMTDYSHLPQLKALSAI